jgi:hypothetical protein
VAVNRVQLEERSTRERQGLCKVGKTWKEVGALAQNRICWGSLVEALCHSMKI